MLRIQCCTNLWAGCEAGGGSPVHKAAVGLLAPDRGLSLRFPRFLRLRPDKQVPCPQQSQVTSRPLFMCCSCICLCRESGDSPTIVEHAWGGDSLSETRSHLWLLWVKPIFDSLFTQPAPQGRPSRFSSHCKGVGLPHHQSELFASDKRISQRLPLVLMQAYALQVEEATSSAQLAEMYHQQARRQKPAPASASAGPSVCGEVSGLAHDESEAGSDDSFSKETTGAADVRRSAADGFHLEDEGDGEC